MSDLIEETYMETEDVFRQVKTSSYLMGFLNGFLAAMALVAIALTISWEGR